jgi:hypothetical protein
MSEYQPPVVNYQNDVTKSNLNLNFIVKDVALKALLFSMVFYILNSSLMNKLLQCLNKYDFIDKNIIQSILFGLIFYMISVNL